MNILKYIFSFSFFIGLCSFAIGQEKQTIIKQIRADYQIINADKHLAKRIVEGEDYLDNIPDGGAELTGYFKKDTLVKIVEWIGLSYGNRIIEYYLKQGRIFFIYERFMSFVTTDTSMDYSKVKLAFEGRYYFHNDKLIERKVSGKMPMKNDSIDNINDVLSNGKEDIKVLISKK